MDTLGLLLAAVVIPPTLATRLVLERLVGRYDRLSDLGRWGLRRKQSGGRWSLELVRRPAGQHTFQVLPRRWVVERLRLVQLQRRSTTKPKPPKPVHRYDRTVDSLAVLLFRHPLRAYPNNWRKRACPLGDRS